MQARLVVLKAIGRLFTGDGSLAFATLAWIGIVVLVLHVHKGGKGSSAALAVGLLAILFENVSRSARHIRLATKAPPQ